MENLSIFCLAFGSFCCAYSLFLFGTGKFTKTPRKSESLCWETTENDLSTGELLYIAGVFFTGLISIATAVVIENMIGQQQPATPPLGQPVRDISVKVYLRVPMAFSHVDKTNFCLQSYLPFISFRDTSTRLLRMLPYT